MKNIGIIGLGEIGSSLNKIYIEKGYTPKIIDPKTNHNDDLKNCDILNICIPFSESFVKIINDYIFKFKPVLTVIHSTVAPGTTKQINGLVCHSPVRGLHPNLDIGIKTFLKYIGSEIKEAATLYSEHLNELQIPFYICKNTLTTEYGKLLDTTYYGLCIAFHADVKQLCDLNKLDFDEVMTSFNTSYNDGYIKLNKNNVIRPVLYATEKIGGHCVIPNANILKKYMNSNFIDGILKYE